MNKKRNIDNIDNSNSNNDNNNSNNNSNNGYIIENLNQFKKLKYHQTTLKQFQQIAESFGIKKYGSKIVVYNGIQLYLETKDKIEKDNRDKENINPFNKDPPKLVISSISGSSSNSSSGIGSTATTATITTIEPLELSFWRVFRNKYIFGSIFSNFKFKSSLSYERLFKCSEILINYSNGLEIIRDKIKSSSYIKYGSLESLYQHLNKKSQQLQYENNHQLLNQLFTNYPNYFTDIDTELKRIANSSNILVLSTFINKYNILDSQIQDSITKIKINNIKQLRFYNYLNKNHNFTFNNNSINHLSLFNKISSITKFIEIIKILVNHNFNNSSGRCKSSNNSVLNNSISSSTISSSTSSSNNIDDFNSLLDEIQQFKLTNNQSKCSFKSQIIISNYLNSNNKFNGQFKDRMNKLRVILLKLVRLYFIIIGDYQSTENKNAEDIINNLSSIDTIKSSDLFKYVYDNYDGTVGGIDFGISSGNGISSSIGNNGRSEKNQFIFKLFEMLYGDKTIVVGSIIKLDDLELLEIINEKYYNSFQRLFDNTSQNNIDENIITSVKSIRVLDFLFRNYQNQIFKNNSNSWVFLSSLELLEHYESLLSSIQRKFLVSSFFPPILAKSLHKDSNHPLIELDLLYRVLSNSSVTGYGSGSDSGSSVYQFKEGFQFEDFRYLFLMYAKANRIDIIVSIFKLFKFDSINLIHLFDNKNRYPFKLLHWIALNYDYKVPTANGKRITVYSIAPTSSTATTPSKEFKITLSLEQYVHLLLFTNDFQTIIKLLCSTDGLNRWFYDHLFLDNNINYTTPNLFQFSNHALNHYFSILDKSSTSKLSSKIKNQIDQLKELLLSILLLSASQGYLDVFKLLYLKYGSLIKKKYKIDGINVQLLNPSDLKNLLYYSFTCTNLEILKILSSFTNFEPISENKISSNFLKINNK